MRRTLPWGSDAPADWAVVPLFNVAEDLDEPNTGNRRSTVLSLSYGQIVQRDVEANFGLLPASFETYNMVDPGDVVLRLTDLQNDKRSLRTGLVGQPGLITSAYTTLRLKEGVEPRFGHYYLHSLDIWKVFYGMGGGVRQSMNYADIRRLPFLLPDKSQQVQIADFLDRETEGIDLLMDKKRRLIDLLEEKRTALITQAVTYGLDRTVPMKDSGMKWVGQIPEGWDSVRLKVVATIQSGLTLGRRFDDEEDLVERPYIRVANVQAGWVDLGSVATIRYPAASVGQFELRKGDVLLTEANGNPWNLGRGALWGGEIEGCLHQNHVFAVRCNRRLIPEYLEAVLETRWARGYFVTTANQVGIATTNREKVLGLPIPLPDVGQQGAIANRSKQIGAQVSRLREALGTQLSLLSEYRQALITGAVTGELDIVGFDGDRAIEEAAG